MMRMLAVGKWSKQQRRWLTVVTLLRNVGARPVAKHKKPVRRPSSPN